MLLCVINGGGFPLQVIEDARNHRRVLYTRYNFDLTAAAFADLNIDIEYPLEALHPGHGAKTP